MENHVQTSPADVPAALPGLVHDNGEALSPQMELVTQLRVLLRCHELARKATRSGSLRILGIVTAALAVPLAIVLGIVIFVVLNDGMRIKDEVAGPVATLVAIFLGGGGLAAGAFLRVYFGQARNVDVPLDEQIRAIVHDHPDRVRTWGGPAVLRMPELVEEVLRVEEERLGGPRPDPADGTP
jgi:hypothetical protein